jgi:hypothetical protein
MLRQEANSSAIGSTVDYTSPFLGLLAALYLSTKHRKGLQILHYSPSPGTFWPLLIAELLEESEVLPENVMFGLYQLQVLRRENHRIAFLSIAGVGMW